MATEFDHSLKNAGDIRQDVAATYRPLSSFKDFKKVRSPLGLGVYASANENFAAASFFRDTKKASEDVLDCKPVIAVESILTGLEFQAPTTNSKKDSIKGEVHHEHRSQEIIDNLNPDPALRASAEEILKKLSESWDGDGKKVTYYGAKDTTPSFITLIMETNAMYPELDILAMTPLDYAKSGRPINVPERQDMSVKESAVLALKGVVSGIVQSDLALREFEMKNPLGIKNKFWKDSATSLVFENGRMVNHAGPIAEIGIQGMTYDALKFSARSLDIDSIDRIVTRDDIDIILRKDSVRDLFSREETETLYDQLSSGEINKLDILAKVVQRQTLSTFWMENTSLGVSYFSSAIDRDPKDPTKSTYRQLDTVSSNPGLLLKSSIFDDLPESEREKYVTSIASVLMGDEFLTDVGIRGRAKRYIDLVPFSDYHGAGTSWIKETDDIAQGLRHQGLHALADQLEYREINAVNIAGSHYEFFYVDRDGKVNFDPHGRRSSASEVVTEKRVIYGTNIPEGDQAWSISSIIRAKREQGKRIKQRTAPSTWQYALEEKILPMVQPRRLLKSHEEIINAFPTQTVYLIDLEKGRELDTVFSREWLDEEAVAA